MGHAAIFRPVAFIKDIRNNSLTVGLEIGKQSPIFNVGM